MGKYRIAGDFRLMGAFWRFGEKNDSFTGTLTCKKGRIEVLSSRIYTSELGDEAARKEFEALLGGTKLERIASLCGFTDDNRCTLFHCLVLDGGGLTNFSTRQKLSAMRYLAARTVMGLHMESSGANVVSSGSLYFTKWHHLLPTPWAWKITKANSSYRLPLTSRKVFRFFSKVIGAQIICEVFADNSAKAKTRTTIKAVPRIRITPRHPKSVDWFTSIAFRTENFLSLFLGTSLSIKRIQLFQGDDEGWVVQKINKADETIGRQLLVKCPHQTVADAFENC